MLTPIQSRKYARLVNEFNEKEFYAYYNHLGEGGTVEDFFDKVEKHGEHDQSSHGDWATGGEGITNVQTGEPKSMGEVTPGVVGTWRTESTADYQTQKGEKFTLTTRHEKIFDGMVNINTKVEDKNGKTIGVLGAQMFQPSYKMATITGVKVVSEHQRKGIATAMLAFARANSQGIPIQHSGDLSAEGRAWSDVNKHGEHDQSDHGSWATGSVPTSITTSTNAIGQETQKITYGDIVIERDKPGEIRFNDDLTRVNWAFRDGGDAMRFVSSRIMGIENASSRPRMIEGERDALLEGKVSPWKKVPEWISGAYTLMEDVHTAEPFPDTLHRGIRVDTNSSIIDIKEGQVLELPLSATSTARRTADLYGGVAGPFEMPVFFTFAKGSKATPIRFSSMADGSAVAEYVTQGKFKVVSVDKSTVVMEEQWSNGKQSRKSGSVEVVLEHTDVFSVDKGGYESIKP